MRRSAVVSVLAVVAACALVAVTASAALVGPQRVFTGDGPGNRHTPSASATWLPVDTSDAPRPPADGEVDRPAWVRLLLTVLWATLQIAALVGLIVVGALVGRRLQRAYQQHSRRERDPVAGVEDHDSLDSVDALGARARVVAAMADDARTQARLLEEGEPRNAIVACWHRFEVQAERAGLGRRPSETASELALRMLADDDIDAVAVSRLLVLYREARFSGHEVDEDDRQAATEALQRIHAGSGVLR
ncbi:conserved exported hypothetical protein [metagenome]|uniref:Protein-glutamine gamma-glutamyltransferase-like C-terminal domain-containing protein n=1 Tax=metagenome TaxID=256318 RepID=A0A2P2CGW0_9ZZZZ